MNARVFSTPAVRRWLVLLIPISTLVLCSALACSGRSGNGASSGTATSAIQTYEVRGQVTRLPEPGREALSIRHEAIPDFVDMDGKVVSMDSMAMPFPLASGLDLADIESGDKVRFTLEVEWEDDDLPYRITEIEKLPADTALDWRG